MLRRRRRQRTALRTSLWTIRSAARAVRSGGACTRTQRHGFPSLRQAKSLSGFLTIDDVCGKSLSGFNARNARLLSTGHLPLRVRLWRGRPRDGVMRRGTTGARRVFQRGSFNHGLWSERVMPAAVCLTMTQPQRVRL